MQTITKAYNLIFITFITIVVCYSTLAVDNTIFNGIIFAKDRAVEILIIPSIIFIAFGLVTERELKITLVDILVFSFVIWVIVSFFLIQKRNYITANSLVFNISIWAIIYILFKNSGSKKNGLLAFIIAFLISSTIQTFLGFQQLYGIKSSLHSYFAITGSFHNPGPLSGYISLSIPILLSIALYFEKENKIFNNKWIFKTIRYIIWIILFFHILILPPTQSRAAWIATFAGVSFVLIIRYKLITKLKLSIFKKKKFVLFSLFLVTFAVAGYFLYKYKEPSANGRALIWKVTAQLIKQKPIAGYGLGAFDALYMNEQATYFEIHNTNINAEMVAGTPEAPFNEFLNIWLTFGIVAIAVLAIVLYQFYQKPTVLMNKNSYSFENMMLLGAKGSLIVFLIFSLFSYPFLLSPFIIFIISVIAVLSNYNKEVFTINKWAGFALFVTISTSLVLHYFPQRKTYYTHLKDWNLANQQYQISNYEQSVNIYKEIYPTFKENGLFLQLYGKALSLDNKHYESNIILTEAKKYCNNQVIENTLGDNYKALGEINRAETAYIKSMYMIPSMLYPKYLLAKLYEENEMKEKAKNMAQIIINHPLKVESTATREMNSYAKEILEK